MSTRIGIYALLTGAACAFSSAAGAQDDQRLVVPLTDPSRPARLEINLFSGDISIEGYDGKPGSRVIVVDDVCTTGDSILKAAEKAEQAGYQVVAAFCVVDREEGGTELIAKRYPFYPLFTAKDLLNDA